MLRRSDQLTIISDEPKLLIAAVGGFPEIKAGTDEGTFITNIQQAIRANDKRHIASALRSAVKSEFLEGSKNILSGRVNQEHRILFIVRHSPDPQYKKLVILLIEDLPNHQYDELDKIEEGYRQNGYGYCGSDKHWSSIVQAISTVKQVNQAPVANTFVNPKSKHKKKKSTYPQFFLDSQTEESAMAHSIETEQELKVTASSSEVSSLPTEVSTATASLSSEDATPSEVTTLFLETSPIGISSTSDESDFSKVSLSMHVPSSPVEETKSPTVSKSQLKSVADRKPKSTPAKKVNKKKKNKSAPALEEKAPTPQLAELQDELARLKAELTKLKAEKKIDEFTRQAYQLLDAHLDTQTFVKSVSSALSLDLIERLLNMGMDPSLHDAERGYSLLHAACDLNKPEVIKLLLDRDADLVSSQILLDRKTSVITQLIIDPEMNVEIFKLIIAKAQENGTLDSQLPLNDPALLLSKVVPANFTGTALHLAVYQANTKAVKALCDQGAKLDQKNVLGHNAYELAVALSNNTKIPNRHRLKIKSQILPLLLAKTTSSLTKTATATTSTSTTTSIVAPLSTASPTAAGHPAATTPAREVNLKYG